MPNNMTKFSRKFILKKNVILVAHNSILCFWVSVISKGYSLYNFLKIFSKKIEFDMFPRLTLCWKSRICWDKHEISTLSGSNLALLEPLHYFSALKANLNHYGFGLMGPTFFPLEICQNDSRCLKTHLLPHVSPKPKNEILDYVLGKRIDFRKNISSTKVLRIEFWVIYISHI